MSIPARSNDPFPEPEIPAYLRPEYMGVAARFHAALIEATTLDEWKPYVVATYAFDHTDAFFAELDRRTKK